MEGNVATEIESNSSSAEIQENAQDPTQQEDKRSSSSGGSQHGGHHEHPSSATSTKLEDTRVFKKSSTSGKLTVYLGKRDYVDHFGWVDPVDGVVLIDKENLKDKKIYGQILVTFSYGRDDLDVLGLTFRKELYYSHQQLYPDPKLPHFFDSCPYFIKGVTNKKSPSRVAVIQPLTRLQERLVKKLGRNAIPFYFKMPHESPPSVTLQQGPGETGKPCGIEYELSIFATRDLKEISKRDSVKLRIRKVMYAPVQPSKQPMVEVCKEFMMSPNKLHLEVSLDKDIYHHGENIAVNVHVSNNSQKSVKKVKVSIRQITDICLFSPASFKWTVAELESEEGFPIGPGSTLSKVYYLTPRLANNIEKRGLALDGRLKHEETTLASSTLLSQLSEKQKESLGVIVQYKVRVKLVLYSPLLGDLLAELPVTLMHPRPKDEIILGADKSTLSDVPPELFTHSIACTCRSLPPEPENEQETTTTSNEQRNLIEFDDDDNKCVYEEFVRLGLDTEDHTRPSQQMNEGVLF